MTEEVLGGGNMTTVMRVGDTVRRTAGRWTPTIQAVLHHLHASGFDRVIKAGGTFKYASPYFSLDKLKTPPVTVTYTGTIQGSAGIAVSHGHEGSNPSLEAETPPAKIDTNIPANTWTTTDGGTVPGDFGTNPEFRYKAVQDRNYSWQSSLGNIFTSVQHVVQTNMAVDATPIYGDETHNIVGYTLSKPHYEYDADGKLINMSSSTRTGVEQGTCPDGGSFVKWVPWNPATDPSTATDNPYNTPFTNNIKSGLSLNGEWL